VRYLSCSKTNDFVHFGGVTMCDDSFYIRYDVSSVPPDLTWYSNPNGIIILSKRCDHSSTLKETLSTYQIFIIWVTIV